MIFCLNLLFHSWRLVAKALVSSFAVFIAISSIHLINSQSDTLAPGGSLSSGQYLTSADGYYQLILKSTGALVGYSVSDGTTFWSAGPSSGSAGPGAILSGTTSLPKSGSTVGSYILLLKF